MKRRVALAGVALLVVLLLVPTLGLSAWTSPESLMPSGVTSTSPVHVAYDGDGNAIAAYTRYLGSTDELYVRERPPGGPWGSPQRVPLDPPLGSYIRDLQLAVNDAGDIVLAFRSGGIHALRRPAGGSWSSVTSWSSPGSSGPGSGCPNRPALDVGEDGTAVVAWAPSSSCNGLVTYWRVLAAGFTPGVGWETTPQVWDLSATDVNSWPGVVVDEDGRATVAFGAQTSSPLGTYEGWTVDRSPSGAWGAPALLSANGGEPVLDSRGGVTVIAWGAPGGILAAIRDPGGWGPVQTLPFPVPADNQWSVAVDGGGTAYVANTPLDGSFRRAYVASHPPGGTWTTTPVSDPDTNARNAAIAANDAGDVGLVWSEQVTGQWLAMAALRPAGGSWPAAGQPVSGTPTGDDRLGGEIAVDRFGHALAVTTPFTGLYQPGGSIIETRDPAVASAGSPPSVSPATAQVGDTLTCSSGTFGGTPPFRYAYAWSRAGSPISGATSSSYETTEDDAGALVRCRVTASNEAGSAGADSNTASVETAGPGPAQDTDGDGLLDEWETNGIDGDGDGTIDLALDQPPYNADPEHKDVFVEVDYMTGYRPQPGSLADVVAAFAAAPVVNPDGADGITLHTLLGESVTTIAPIVFLDRGPGAADDFDDLKYGGVAPCDGFFGTPTERSGANCAATLAAKKLAFHYSVFGHSYAESPGSSGVAELPGNDFMVTLGGKTAEWIAAAGGLRSAEAGTFMHELGHNFDLHHGGADDINCKPNYQSIMSYTRQVPNLDPDRPLDYSDEELPTLYEWYLDEAAGIGAGDGTVIFGVAGTARVVPDGEVDWNDDGSIDYPVGYDPDDVTDINWIKRADGTDLCVASVYETLVGHDDWSTLLFDFRGTSDYADGVHESARPVATSELTSQMALETAKTVDVDGDGTSNLAESVCGVTRGYVQASGKYGSAKPVQRVAANSLVAVACKAVEAITRSTKPAQKRALVAAYKKGVDALRAAGWLTAAEAATLKSAADTL
jgi:hypothetical protein